MFWINLENRPLARDEPVEFEGHITDRFRRL